MAALEELSTASVAARDKLPFWNEIAERLVAPIRVEAVEPSTFEARIYRKRFRDFELLSPVSSPARIFSSPDHGHAGVFNVQIQHVGRSTNHTAGRTSVLEEGDFLLYDPSQPLWLTFEVPTQAIVLRLPVATVEERLPRLRGMAGIRMDGRSGPGAIFSGFVRNAWTQLHAEDGDWADSLSDLIWPLLDMAYAPERQPDPDATRRGARRRAVFAAIDADLCDPDLDTRRIASRVGVSPRYVQMLFAEMATTPTAFIQGRRLELAARRLELEGMSTTITEVAYDVGFNDLSSFCRAFRRRYDVSASGYRAGRRRLDS
jgi:AraC-like DNA-binding protein